MIDGLRCDVKGTELKAHCSDRAKFHENEWKRYAEKLSFLHETKATMLKEKGTINKEELSAQLDAKNFKGEAREGEIEQSANRHREQHKYFAYISEHLVESETYRLWVEDLKKLEIVAANFY